MQKANKVIVSVLVSLLPIFLLFPHLENKISAEEIIKGKVIEVRDGKLERLANNEWKQIAKNGQVFLGDRLRTDKKGLAIIEMPNIGRFVIGPDSEIELGKDNKDFKADMPRGAVWLNSKFRKCSNGSITTSLATAGIRGTKFSVFYGRGTQDLCVCTCIGNVDATLNNGKTIPVSKGNILVIKGDAPLPENAESALPILDNKGAGFDFCFNCHVTGGRGKLKSTWK